MIYLDSFRVPDQHAEDMYLHEIKMTCFDSYYPFHVFRYRRVPEITFAPITILYGGNGA